MRRRWVFGAVAGLAVILLAGRLVAGWYVDYHWYEALGASSLFWARAGNLLLLRGTAFLVGTLLVFLNLYAVRHSVVAVVFPRRVGNIEIGEEIPGRYLLWAVLLVSVGVGALLALPHRDWMSLDLVRHGEPFSEADPYFQHDLAFWTYWFPLESAVQLWALVALVAVSLIVVFLYALTPSLRWESGRLRISSWVRRHFFVLGGLSLLLLAWSYRLDAYRLLLQGGPAGAFGALDHRIGIPANLLLALATIVAAMLVVWAGWVGQLRMAFITLGAVLVLSLGARHLVPPIMIRFIAPSDAEARDRPYAATRAAFTRRAFDTDAVLTTGPNDLQPSRAALVRGIPLWDPEALRRAIAFQRTGGRVTGAVGWQQQDGRPLALMAEAPIGPDAADPLAPWAVVRYESVLADENGSVVRDRSLGDDADRIAAALVSDSAAGDAVVIDSLGIVAGPALSSFGTRLLHAWGLQNPRLLGQDPGSDPAVVVQHRDVRERVARLYPFFAPGNRTTPLMHGDSLLWVTHLYASSHSYPLSDPVVTPRTDVRYFRHAAVAIANAHTGRVTAIVHGGPDPLTVSWLRRFPSLFVPASAMPEAFLRQLPPPNDLALVQARVLARFGRRGDVAPPSHIARPAGGDTLFAFPAATPFVDPVTRRLAVAYPILDAADRLRGVFSASGGVDYQPRWTPFETLGPRWVTLLERLRHALDSAAATGTRAGVTSIRGPVRAIASGHRVMFMQTAYEWRPEAAPLARHAALLVGDSVRVARTVMAAAGIAEPAVAVQQLTPEAFRARVAVLYREMEAALARGDWPAFGVAWDALGKLLRAAPSVP